MIRSYTRWLGLLFISVMTIFSTLAAQAADAKQWRITPNASTLTFTATQNNAPVSGQFKTFSGDIHFDPNQLATSSVNIVIDMNAISASYDELTTTLQSSDWFDVKQFPQAVFKASNFKKTGDKTYEAVGALTLRDKTAPVMVSFSLDNYSDTQLVISGTTTLKRTVFGVGQGEWAKTGEVKDDVRVDFKLVAGN
jgi:polyisoprenoid-binding protein YceI